MTRGTPMRTCDPEVTAHGERELKVHQIDIFKGLMGRNKMARLAGVSALAMCAVAMPGDAYAQTADTVTAAPQDADQSTGTAQTDTKQPAAPADIVVTGQRAAIQSAIQIKRNASEIVDSITSDDIVKLPDRSVTEALQRVTGVTIDHFIARNDPDHFSVEGSGVNIRGLTFVRSEINGRDSFSANGGRSLSFEDVPPELLA